MENKLTVGSLFSGIGGLDLGFEQSGFEIKYFVENDLNCVSVLQKNFPNAEIHFDIRDFHPPYKTDLLIGGFPCQPFSVAGKKKGLKDDRYLWHEYFRVVQEVMPKYIVIENVVGFLKNGLWNLITDLTKIGYDAEWEILPASAFGAPHQRERLFVVAYPSGFGRERGTVFSRDNEIYRYEEWDSTKNIKQWDQWVAWINEVDKNGLGAVGRDIEPLLCRVDDGFSAKLVKNRVAQLGNAVAVPVAQYVAKSIRIHYNKNMRS